jgi:hypothetical protein
MALTRDRIKGFFDEYAACRTVASSPGPPATNRFKGFFEQFRSARQRETSQTSHLALDYEGFLTGYIAARDELADQVSVRALKFTDFLKGFGAARIIALARAKEIAAKQVQGFQILLEDHSKALAIWEKTQQDKADRFYILEVLDLTHNEECHSRMLAWLLDRNYRRLGTHAQDRLGFRLFLSALSALNISTSLADEPYFVRREISGDESRIDIEIAARGRFLMHIEVKIGAQEGHEQTNREWKDLRKRASELDIREDGLTGGIIAIFVTPSGRTATDPNFKAVSWRQIAQVLEDFGNQAQAQDVKLFARHYAHTLRDFIAVAEQEEREDQHAGP